MLLAGWSDRWVMADTDPVQEANELMLSHQYEQAREILEEALQNSRGNIAAVRKALREVSYKICNPRLS